MASGKRRVLLRAAPDDIRFTQDTVRVHFAPPHARSRLDETVDLIMSKRLSAKDFPTMCVLLVKDQLWTLNNRRLWVFRKAGVARITVRLQGRFDDASNPFFSTYLYKTMSHKHFIPQVRGSCRLHFHPPEMGPGPTNLQGRTSSGRGRPVVIQNSPRSPSPKSRSDPSLASTAASPRDRRLHSESVKHPMQVNRSASSRKSTSDSTLTFVKSIRRPERYARKVANYPSKNGGMSEDEGRVLTLQKQHEVDVEELGGDAEDVLRKYQENLRLVSAVSHRPLVARNAERSRSRNHTTGISSCLQLNQQRRGYDEVRELQPGPPAANGHGNGVPVSEVSTGEETTQGRPAGFRACEEDVAKKRPRAASDESGTALHVKSSANSSANPDVGDQTSIMKQPKSPAAAESADGTEELGMFRAPEATWRRGLQFKTPRRGETMQELSATREPAVVDDTVMIMELSPTDMDAHQSTERMQPLGVAVNVHKREEEESYETSLAAGIDNVNLGPAHNVNVMGDSEKKLKDFVPCAQLTPPNAHEIYPGQEFYVRIQPVQGGSSSGHGGAGRNLHVGPFTVVRIVNMWSSVLDIPAKCPLFPIVSNRCLKALLCESDIVVESWRGESTCKLNTELPAADD